MSYKYSLKKYSGTSSRHTCPSCGKPKQFTRYIDNDTGFDLAEDVGICNRVSKCGYHYSPKQFFADNPNTERPRRQREIRTVKPRTPIPAVFDTVDRNVLERTLSSDLPNALRSFMAALGGSNVADKAAKTYLLGTWRDARCVFWQVDVKHRIRSGKLIRYNPSTGKRDKYVSWVHKHLLPQEIVRPDVGGEPDKFRLKQCLFGEHLLTERSKPVAIVESEKTAMVASMFFPSRIWVATGGCTNLKPESLLVCGPARDITLYPDSTRFEQWTKVAFQARLLGFSVKVSDFLERKLNADQKADDMDIADLIIQLRRRGGK